MGELKNRKWELNAHLFSSLDLNESQPLDLRVTQKVIWRLKGEEKRKRSIHSFMSIWEKEKREQGENFWAVRKWSRAARRHLNESGQQHLLACIPRKNHIAWERQIYRGRGTTQKSRKRDNMFWAHFSRLSVKHLMLFYCCKNFYFGCLLIGMIFEVEFKHGKRDKL